MHSIRWHGRCIGSVQERLEQWLTEAFRDPKDPHTPVWKTVETKEEWQPATDVHAALQMAHWVQRGDELTLTEEEIELASRLLPEACRAYGEEQPRRDTELKPPPITDSASSEALET